MIAAIVLAAGKSERMGRPKALLPIAGENFLSHILAAIDASSVQHKVVVLGHHRQIIEQSTRLENAVFNPDYEAGMITSLQTGIRALPPETAGALLCLVDHPVLHPSTIDTLIEHFKPGHIILPTFEGKRGHPVLFSKEVLAEILGLPQNAGANTVVWRNPSRVVEVPVSDRGILLDIDTPQQYEELSS